MVYMKIEVANHFQGQSIYFDTATIQGRNRARNWHLQTGEYYNDHPRQYNGNWYDAKGDLIKDIRAFEENMQQAYGYIYDLLVTLNQCRVNTAERKQQRQA